MFDLDIKYILPSALGHLNNDVLFTLHSTVTNGGQ